MTEAIERLRKYVAANTDRETVLTSYPPQYRVVCSTTINDLIDAIEREVESNFIELPKDADGERIHIGDELDCGKVYRIEIASDGDHKAYVQKNQSNPQLEGHLCKYVHHKPHTVEDVLREFTDAILEWAGESGTVAEVGTWSDIASKYIAKLQLREEQ